MIDRLCPCIWLDAGGQFAKETKSESRRPQGTSSAHSLSEMRPKPTNPLHDPTQVITLEIDIAEADIPALAGAPANHSPAETPRPARKVLLLEDRDDFREILRDHLTFRGFEVISVPSGIEGLQEIRNCAFDLIICDMMMPRMGGEMFYWAVTRLRPATAPRFIFFTGHRNNAAIEFFFKRVHATVLTKPFQLSAFDSTIDEILRNLD